MNINTITQYVTYALALIGILAFIVSAVVQVIKDLPGLKNIQTSIVALTASLILCPVTLLILCTYYKAAITWYYIVAYERTDNNEQYYKYNKEYHNINRQNRSPVSSYPEGQQRNSSIYAAGHARSEGRW